MNRYTAFCRFAMATFLCLCRIPPVSMTELETTGARLSMSMSLMSFGMGGSLTAKGLSCSTTVLCTRLSLAEVQKGVHEWLQEAAAARQFEAGAINLAVTAHVRHTHTQYDRLLAQGWERSDARAAVSDLLAEVMRRWR